MTFANNIFEPSILNRRYVDVSEKVSNQLAPFCRIPREISQLIFSRDELSLKDLISLNRVCKGFYQIFTKMDANDSLGKLVLSKFFPKVAVKITFQHAHTSSYRDQARVILRKYQEQRRLGPKLVQSLRFKAFLFAGTQKHDGLIEQMNSCTIRFEEQTAPQYNVDHPKDCWALCEEFSRCLDSIFLEPSKKLIEEVIKLVGNRYNGRDESIDPSSQLGQLLSKKAWEVSPSQLSQFSQQEGCIRQRLILLLGNGQEKGMIALLKEGNDHLHEFLKNRFADGIIQGDGLLDASRMIYNLLLQEKKALTYQLRNLIGPKYDGKDESLSANCELFQALEKLKCLEGNFSELSQKSYDQFVESGDLTFLNFFNG